MKITHPITSLGNGVSKTPKKPSNDKMKSSKKMSNPDTEKDEQSMEDKLQDIMDKAHERFDATLQAWQTIRTDAAADLKFYEGDMWATDLQKVSNTRNEPIITNNLLPNMVKNIENSIRQMQICINVVPTDENGSDETAEVFSGLVRHIEQCSHAPSQYIHAAGENGALVPGMGFLRLETCYSKSKGFEQEIRIKAINDPFTILPDADCLEPDSSDAKCWFEFKDYTKDEYKRLFPSSELSSAEYSAPGARITVAVGADGIRVVKYWYKEELEVMQYLLSDGTTVDNVGWYDPNADEEDQDNDRSPFPKDDEGNSISKPKAQDGKVKKPFPRDSDGNPQRVLSKRQVIDSKVKWVIFNGVEVLDHGEWSDNEFPFVSIYGPTLIINGVKKIRGIIHQAKDAQKMLTYVTSSIIRRIASANKSPWIASASQIKGFEKYWKNANTDNYAVLLYNDTDPDNPERQLAPPQRADQMGQINDLLQAVQVFNNAVKQTVGIYDAGLGATANDQSGVAIKTLAQQGQDNNYHFSDALVRGIERLGYLLLRLIPKIYDTPRAVRIVAPDTTEQLIKINQIFSKDGQQVMHDLSNADSYDVNITAGPSYATKKQKNLEILGQLMAKDPALAEMVQDIFVGELDLPAAKIIQERLVKQFAAKFPNLVSSEGQQPLPPQAQAQFGQMQQMIQQLSQQVHQQQDKITELVYEKHVKMVEHQNKMEEIQAMTMSKIAEQKTRGLVDANLAQADAKIEENIAERDARIDFAAKELDHQHEMKKTVIGLAQDGHLTDIIDNAGIRNEPPAPRF